MPDSLRRKRSNEKKNIEFSKEMFGDKPKEQNAAPTHTAKEELPTNDVEIVAVVSKKIYEVAGGDINKIFNNTPSDMFLPEEPDRQEEQRIEIPMDSKKIDQKKNIDSFIKPAEATRNFENTGTLGSLMSNANVQVTRSIKKPLKPDKLKKKLEERASVQPDEKPSIVKEVAEADAPTGKMAAGRLSIEEETATTLLSANNEYLPGMAFPSLISMSSGETFAINKAVFTVGHSSKCDLQIKEPGSTHNVSRRHAVFYLKNEDTYLVDQSTNGTFIGSDPDDMNSFIKMMKDQETQIKDGQYIIFANVMFKFISGKEK